MFPARTLCSRRLMRNTDRVVAEARSWVGTPYVHQHMTRGHAVDCVGLAAGVLPTWTPELWEPHQSYGRAPNPAHMRKAIAEFLEPIDAPGAEPQADGSVAFMAWRSGMPMHLAIMATAPDGRRTMIHAFSHVGRVVEHGFDQEWPGRVESWWKYPGV